MLRPVTGKRDYYTNKLSPEINAKTVFSAWFQAHLLTAIAEGSVEFIRKAKKEIVIIDAYADDIALQILAKKRAGVGVTIVKGPRARLSALDVVKFNTQYGGLTVKTSKVFHDRFIILDDAMLLHVGASLNHLGKRCFAFSSMDASSIPDIVAKIP